MSRKHKRELRRQQMQAAKPAEPTATGRPTALTPEIAKKLVDAARAGTPVGFLGPLAGVHRATVFEWLRKGAKPNTPYTAFHDAIKAAQSAYVGECLGEIAGHGKTSWQARAWLLERMFRDEFGGDKLELNQLKKELKELRQLLLKVPRDPGEETPEADGETEGGGGGPPDGPAEAAQAPPV